MAELTMKRDWDNREFVQNVQYNLVQCCDFLNHFDSTTRYRLAKLNEKLIRLERQVDFLEARAKHFLPQQQQQQQQQQTH